MDAPLSNRVIFCIIFGVGFLGGSVLLICSILDPQTTITEALLTSLCGYSFSIIALLPVTIYYLIKFIKEEKIKFIEKEKSLVKSIKKERRMKIPKNILNISLLATCVFFGLRAANITDWSWVAVFSPLIILGGIGLIAVIFLLIVIKMFVGGNHGKSNG